MGSDQPDADAHNRLVLVTGGAGFLGTRTVDRLRSAGHPVAVLDDGSGGKADRLRRFDADPKIRLYRVDLRDRTAVATVCERDRPWAVIHLAARHFIPFCEAHPQQTWQVNVEGTRSLVDALASYPPRRFLFASTAEVYREAASPHREEDPLGSATVYGRSKIAAEQVLRETLASWDTDLVIGRLFNLYGPDPTAAHLIPSIAAQVATGDDLQLGDLTTVRDFVYVEDAAAAVVELVVRAPGGVYNIGTETATSGEDLVELVAKLLGRDLTVTVDPDRLRQHSRHALIAARTKLRRALPWWPATPLDVGLKNVLDSHGGDPTRRPHLGQSTGREGPP